MRRTLVRTKRRTNSRRAQQTPRAVKRYSLQDIAKFREMILMLRNETLEEVEALKESIEQKELEPSVHSLHDATSGDHLPDSNIYEYGRELRLIKELDAALERIEKREYGVCRKCGALIEKMRLQAIPHARLCFRCKDSHENAPHYTR